MKSGIKKQEFAYETTEKGIKIVRCYGVSSVVEIPEQIDGLPVTELSDYAFAEKLEEEPEHCMEFPCICGTQLEELHLPQTIRKFGRYLFYNCFCLKKLSFYSNISSIGAGAFTGCGCLTELNMQEAGQAGNCLREMLTDLKQSVEVQVLAEGVLKYRLVYPEFYEEAVENTPARIVNTSTHGMGIHYRNTFQEARIMFQEYDKLFGIGKYNIDLIDAIRIAETRLHYSFELSEGAKKEYRIFLEEHLKEAVTHFQKKDGLEELRWIAEQFVEDSVQAAAIIEAVSEQKNVAALSLLMDIRHRRFAKSQKKFSL